MLRFVARVLIARQHDLCDKQAAIIALFRVINRYVGNLPPMPASLASLAEAREQMPGASKQLR
jgi:hypothetical protein